MRFKLLSLVAAASLVAACSTTPTADNGKTTSGGSAAAGHSTAKATMTNVQDRLVQVGDRVHFGFDQYNLTPKTRYVLMKQAALLKKNGAAKITVEGHCDERGTREYNLALGERRANAVKDYLMTLGVSAERINTISYGKERPEDAASNEEAWAKNRRAVTVLR